MLYEIFKLMSSFGCCPLIRRSIRVIRVTHDSETLIDHLRTTDPSDVIDSGIILYDLFYFPFFTLMKKSYNDSDVDDR